MKLNLSFFLSIVGLLLVTLIGTTVFASNAQIGGQVNGYQCAGSFSNRWKTENDSSATLPAGYTFENIYVKAGQSCITVYPNNSAPSCYTVSISGTTVNVVKIGSGPQCKDISHLEGTYTISSTPTATGTSTSRPTATPTPTATATSTSQPSITPSATATATATGTAKSSGTPTATGTSKATSTATSTSIASATPTATPGNGDVCPNIAGIQTSLPNGMHFGLLGDCLNFSDPGPGDSGIGGGDILGSSTGQVLGTSTMATTGAVQDALFNSIFTLGSLLTSFGIMKNGKKKA